MQAATPSTAPGIPSATTTAPAPLPSQTPRTGFGAREEQPGGDDGRDAGPMANFGFTVAAYAVLWVVLFLFLLESWRRQVGLDGRLKALEAAIAKGPSPVRSVKAVAASAPRG